MRDLTKLTTAILVVIVLVLSFELGYLDFLVKPIQQAMSKSDEYKDRMNIEKQASNYIKKYLNKQVANITNNMLNISASADSRLSLGKYELVKADTSKNNEVIEFVKSYFNFLNIYRTTDQIPEIKKYQSKDMDLIETIFSDWWATNDCKVIKYEDIRVLNSSDGKYLVGAHIILNRIMPDGDKTADVEGLIKVIVVEEGGQYKILSQESVPLDSINEFMKKINTEQENQSANNQEEIASPMDINTDNVAKYAPKGDSGGDYNESKNLDNVRIKFIVKENDSKTVAILVKTKNGDTVGSGFFVRPGIVVTNVHVVNKGISGQVRTADGETHEIEGIVSIDGVLDMAVLKLKEEIGSPVKLGEPENLEKADPVLAIGSPMGLYNTVTVGIFNNLWKEESGKVTLQSSLPLAPGNSGGPLFNIDGEVVGINTSIENGYADISFAGSINHLKDIIRKLQSMSFSSIKSINWNKVDWK